jgi:5-methylthioadenosine/S-adenosylhomocysteine deaminase
MLQPMKAVDSLISARWVAPVDGTDRVLEDHSVVVHEGRIEALLPTSQARSAYEADQAIDLPRHLLTPGLINAHTHAAMSLLRGYADDLPLHEWLNGHVWPAESRWVSEDFVEDGTLLAIAEMLRSGTTCFNDMYFFPDAAARTASHVGMRAVVGLIVLDFPSVWAGSASEYLARGLEVHDTFRGDPLVTTALAPHAPYTVSDGPLERIAMYTAELELPVHMHVNETAAEIEEALAKTGETPVDRLERVGLLSPSLLAVHATQMTAAEIERFARQAVTVVHCPESNLKLASGLCPVQRLVDGGVRVVIGTDGAASNNDLDMLGEMRTAALLAKAVANDASAFPAHRALRAATIEAATALGIDAVTGSIETGKAADLVAVDLGQLESQPLYDPLSQLVYAAGREQVSDVWVAGRQLLKARRLTTIDEQEVLDRAKEWQQRISGS